MACVQAIEMAVDLPDQWWLYFTRAFNASWWTCSLCEYTSRRSTNGCRFAIDGSGDGYSTV